MLGKKTIIYCLLPAYVLLLLHAIIPHHHHHGSNEDQSQFHHAFNVDHEDHDVHIINHEDHEGECCAKDHHCDQSPENHDVLIKSGFKRIKIQHVKSIPGYLLDIANSGINQTDFCHQIKDGDRFQLFKNYFVKSSSLRGPPRSLAIA